MEVDEGQGVMFRRRVGRANIVATVLWVQRREGLCCFVAREDVDDSGIELWWMMASVVLAKNTCQNTRVAHRMQ